MCHEYPRAVEVMVNSYEHIKYTKKWRDAISEAVYEVRNKLCLYNTNNEQNEKI